MFLSFFLKAFIFAYRLTVDINVLSLPQSEFFVGHDVNAVHVIAGMVLPHVCPDLTALPGSRVWTIRTLKSLGHSTFVLDMTEHMSTIFVGFWALGTSITFFAICTFRSRWLSRDARPEFQKSWNIRKTETFLLLVKFIENCSFS